MRLFISFDFAARRPAARLAAPTMYAVPDASSNSKICDFLENIGGNHRPYFVSATPPAGQTSRVNL
jgi:hypothetical protein